MRTRLSVGGSNIRLPLVPDGFGSVTFLTKSAQTGRTVTEKGLD